MEPAWANMCRNGTEMKAKLDQNGETWSRDRAKLCKSKESGAKIDERGAKIEQHGARILQSAIAMSFRGQAEP